MVANKETSNLMTLLARKREKEKKRFFGWFLDEDRPEPIILPDDEDGLGD